MSPFAFHRASSVANAIAQLGSDGAFLAGGTNLIDQMRLGIRSPRNLVDINHLGSDQIIRTNASRTQSS